MTNNYYYDWRFFLLMEDQTTVLQFVNWQYQISIFCQRIWFAGSVWDVAENSDESTNVSHAAKGSVNVKVAPFPSLLFSAHILPP